MTDYATLGTLTLLRRHQKARAYPQALARPGHPVVGWTAPTLAYDKMRQLDPGARELNALILANVQKPLLRAAWDAWFKNWTAFFDKYQSEWALSRWSVPFYSDDFARQVDGYVAEYASFRATYAAEKAPDGKPLPLPSSPVPPPILGPDEKPHGIEIPWWVWVLGGAGLVVGGYYLYKTTRKIAHETNAKKRAIEGVLPKLIGEDLGRAAQAHDPSGPRQAPPPVVALVLAPSDIYRDPEPSTHPSTTSLEDHDTADVDDED